MFVWNFYTNDARVKRECTTLSDSGYKVNLFALKNKKNNKLKSHEKVKNNFEVNRIEKTSFLIQFISDHKFFAIIFILLLNLFFLLKSISKPKYIFVFLFLTVNQFLFVKIKKIRTSLINVSTIIRMILNGYKKHSNIYHANDLNTLPQAIFCAKLRFKPKLVVYDSHEVQTDRTGYNKTFVRIFEKALLIFVDKMIVENETRAKYNEKIYGFKPEVLYNYSELLDIKEFKSANIHKMLNLDKKEKILLYQGGIQKGRGLENLIEAMDFIEEGHLVFIGDGNLKNDLINKAKKSFVKGRIHFVDKVELADLPSYTKDAFIGFQVLQNICFNHFSASSNKLFEYIMAEVPVITCNFPEISKVVNENKIGLVIDSHKVKEIAQAVNKIIKDDNLYNYFKDNTVKTKKIYNWEIEKEKLIKVYDELF